MSARVERARPDAREVRAAVLAAVGEAAVISLPLHVVLTRTGGAELGTLAFAPIFLGLFVAGVVAVGWYRESRWVTIITSTAAVVAGVWIGREDPNRALFEVLVLLLVAFRVVTLGLRDWRDPIYASIGWGAVALAGEVIVASGAQPDWRGPLVVFVPLFFVASLSSRATVVWTPSAGDDLSEHARAGWLRRAVAWCAALGASLAMVVLLMVRGGLADGVQRALTPVMTWLAEGLAWLLAQVARPVLWLVDQLNIDPEDYRRALERLQEQAGRAHRRALRADPLPPFVQRILALVLFGAFAVALIVVLRGLRSRARPAGRPTEVPVPAVTVPLAETIESTGPEGRELPDDTVRRWYAQALLELEHHELPKDPSITPTEYVPVVAAVYPGCAADFRALTRAYEDVRYGSRVFAADAVASLEPRATAVLDALRSPPEVEPPPVD